MKKVLFASTVAFVLLFNACKKDTVSTEEELALQVTSQTNANDQARLQNDDDVFSNDAAQAIDNDAEFGTVPSKNVDSATIEGAVIDKRGLLNKKVVLSYWGKNINGVIKTGKITIELISGSKWRDAGAVIKQTFDTCSITRNNKTIVFNGTRYVTNVKGGTFAGMYLKGDTIVHQVRVNGTVTFENGATKTWWAARRNTYFIKLLSLNFISSGDTLINSEACAMGGISRFGNAFVVKAPIDLKIVNTTTCVGKPQSGVRVFTSDNRTVTVTYGVDSQGNAVTSGCAYGYKVEWTKYNNAKGSAIIAY